METVREILKCRDSLDDAGVDEQFEALAEELQEGSDPEEALASVFGLEADCLTDPEVWGVIEKSWRSE